MNGENTTIAERIANALGKRIINGALRPDAPLRQDHIAREFSSSHVPVREAFRQLEAKLLVVAVPRRGMRVASLDTQSVKEIAEMRAALEMVALRNSASRLTSCGFGVIELALMNGDNARTIEELEKANRAFHHALIAPCGVPRPLASFEFAIDVREGLQCRMATTIKSGSPPDFTSATRTTSIGPAICSSAIFRRSNGFPFPCLHADGDLARP